MSIDTDKTKWNKQEKEFMEKYGTSLLAKEFIRALPRIKT